MIRRIPHWSFPTSQQQAEEVQEFKLQAHNLLLLFISFKHILLYPVLASEKPLRTWKITRSKWWHKAGRMTGNISTLLLKDLLCEKVDPHAFTISAVAAIKAQCVSAMSLTTWWYSRMGVPQKALISEDVSCDMSKTFFTERNNIFSFFVLVFFAPLSFQLLPVSVKLHYCAIVPFLVLMPCWLLRIDENWC